MHSYYIVSYRLWNGKLQSKPNTVIFFNILWLTFSRALQQKQPQNPSLPLLIKVYSWFPCTGEEATRQSSKELWAPVFLVEETTSWKFRNFPKTSAPSGQMWAAVIIATVLFSPREGGTKAEMSPWSLSVSWQPWPCWCRWGGSCPNCRSDQTVAFSASHLQCPGHRWKKESWGAAAEVLTALLVRTDLKERAMPRSSQCCSCGRRCPVSHFGRFTACGQCGNKPKKQEKNQTPFKVSDSCDLSNFCLFLCEPCGLAALLI